MIAYYFYVIIHSDCPTPTFPSASKPCQLYAFLISLEGDFRKLQNGRASVIMTKKQYVTMRILLYAVKNIFDSL